MFILFTIEFENKIYYEAFEMLYWKTFFLHEIHGFRSRIRILIPIQKYMYDVLYVHFLSVFKHFREISNTVCSPALIGPNYL